MIISYTSPVGSCDRCQILIPSCQKYCAGCALELGYNEITGKFYNKEDIQI